MKILVTGGAGFIGSHVVEKCMALGHTVEVMDDFNDAYDPSVKRANVAGFRPHVRIHEVDIRDGTAVCGVVKREKFDAIFHLAARAGVRPSIIDPKLYIETNVTGTFHL